jgi:hypothetical protein
LFRGTNAAATKEVLPGIYTENPIREGVEVDQLLERIRYGVLLGSQEWTAKMRMLLSGDEREQRALAAARKEGVAFEDIAASIAREFGEPWEDLVSGHPKCTTGDRN